jgi:hypothetical protein
MASPYFDQREKFVKTFRTISSSAGIVPLHSSGTKNPAHLTGSFNAQLFSGTSCDLRKKFGFRPLGRRGFDLSGLHRVLAKTCLVLGLAAPYAVVEGKFSPIVFDIRISHTFAPSPSVDTGKNPFA